MKINPENLTCRYESFGGIISSEAPPFLAHVDKEFMKEIGQEGSVLWEEESGKLSAPLEVHFSITNQCSAGCPNCYTDSKKTDPHQLPKEEIFKLIDILSEMKVFHIALGGGEALEREDLFDIAEYARSKGIIPNLTTNGYLITEDNVDRFKCFGQVNVSIDGINKTYEDVRGSDNFKKADAALTLLQKNGVRSGINTVLTQASFNTLEELVKYAKGKKVFDVELLRLKPTGRAGDNYENQRMTDRQHREFYVTVNRLYKKYKVRLKADCSFLPMIAYHSPKKKIMEQFSVYGCEAGGVLLGVNSSGHFAGCSFLHNNEKLETLKISWNDSPHLNDCRSITDQLGFPCSECDYMSICKGGCRGVALYYNNKQIHADPECPIIIENRRNNYV